MKNYLIILFVLMISFSCEREDELDNILSANGNELAPPPGGGSGGGAGGGTGTPVGGGGGNGGGTGTPGCPLAGCTIETIVQGCMSKNSLTTLEIQNHGEDINWVVAEGNFITINKYGNTITLFGGDDFTGGKVIGTKPGISFTFNISVCPAPPLCRPNNTLNVLDTYIDGTDSGHDYVHLMIASNWPVGTTYAWQTVRQDGTVEDYTPSTETARNVSASRENPITRVIVTAKYGDCERGVITDFSPAVPQVGSSGGPTSVSSLKFIKKFVFTK